MQANPQLRYPWHNPMGSLSWQDQLFKSVCKINFKSMFAAATKNTEQNTYTKKIAYSPQHRKSHSRCPGKKINYSQPKGLFCAFSCYRERNYSCKIYLGQQFKSLQERTKYPEVPALERGRRRWDGKGCKGPTLMYPFALAIILFHNWRRQRQRGERGQEEPSPSKRGWGAMKRGLKNNNLPPVGICKHALTCTHTIWTELKKLNLGVSIGKGW